MTALLMIRKLSLPPISSSEDSYGPSCVLVLAFALPHPLPGAAVASLLAASATFPLPSRQQTYAIAPSPSASLPRRLPLLSFRLPSLVGRRASDCSGAALVRGEKPERSTQAHEHRRLRLSQPAVPVLRKLRRSVPRPRRGWQAWSG